MKRLILYFSVILIIFTFLFNPEVMYAATIRSGESVDTLESETGLSDLYLFGNTITADAPVENDLTTAGATVTLNGDVTGSILAAGGDLVIRSRIGNTLRVAGGKVVISGPVENDLLAAGGNIRTANTASVSGDLLVAGGDIIINSPVNGNILAYGGDVTINSRVGGNVEGNIGKLTLGENAVINGNLKYMAGEKATINKGAVVRGRHDFQKVEDQRKQPQTPVAFLTAGSLYKLAIDVIIGLLLISLLPVLVKNILESIVNSPLASLGSGFLFIFFWPLLSVFLLLFLWLGAASFLIYGLILLIGLYIGKIYLGLVLLQWWHRREKRNYALDWKAVVLGSITMYVLLLIPVIGWLAAFIIYLLAVGGLVRSLIVFVQMQKLPKTRKS